MLRLGNADSNTAAEHIEAPGWRPRSWPAGRGTGC
jgi:hypothetical protein